MRGSQMRQMEKVRSGAGTGDNYTSTLYRVSVRGSSAGAPWRRSLMCKCLPADLEQRQAFKSDLLFRNEVAFYTEALPALLDFQVGKLLAAEDGTDGAGYLQRLRAFTSDGDFFGRMVALVQPREPLAVLCHGDCWTNNLLFRYGDDGAILEVCLIDFQMARYASPALDISNLLYVCTTPELRAQHGRQLLRGYHCSLVDTLRELGCEEPSAEELWDMLEAEMRDCGRFGLGLALDMLPITTCETGVAPRLREGGDAGAGGGPAWTYQCTEECARRMAGLVKDLVDSGQL